MEKFECSTKIYTGCGALDALGHLQIRRLLVVTDPYFMKNGTAQTLAQRAKAENTEFFDGVKPDPSVELVAQGANLVRQFQPDTIVALGGGSAMDCAKAMAYFGGGNARLVAIPTTSGSGSEVTDFAILTHDRVKHPLIHENIRPSVAILDEDLLQALPAGLVADTGFDVLSHALEALVATHATGFTRALATEAFCVTFTHLKASFQGELSVRGKIHEAATMAGMAFTQAGLGVCHGLSHALGGTFHVPHGRLNAILIPAVVGCNQSTHLYGALARQVGLGGSTDTMAVRNLKNGLIRLRRELQLPATLQEAGISRAQLSQHRQSLIDAALKDPCCKTNPVPVDARLVSRLLDAVSHG